MTKLPAGFSKIFQSRKATLAFLFLVFRVLAALLPSFGVNVDAFALEQAMNAAAVIVGVAVFGITVEDSVRVWAENRPASSGDAAKTVVDSFTQPPSPAPTPLPAPELSIASKSEAKPLMPVVGG